MGTARTKACCSLRERCHVTPAASSTMRPTSEPNDCRDLYPMAKASKATLGVSTRDGRGDAGRYQVDAVAGPPGQGITPCVPTRIVSQTQSGANGPSFGSIGAFVLQAGDGSNCTVRRSGSCGKQEVMRRDFMTSTWPAIAPAADQALDVRTAYALRQCGSA